MHFLFLCGAPHISLDDNVVKSWCRFFPVSSFLLEGGLFVSKLHSSFTTPAELPLPFEYCLAPVWYAKAS